MRTFPKLLAIQRNVTLIVRIPLMPACFTSVKHGTPFVCTSELQSVKGDVLAGAVLAGFGGGLLVIHS